MKKFLKSPLGIGLITTLFGFILTVIYDMLKGKQILSTLLNILKMIGRCIISFLNLNLKLWWVLLGIVILVLVLWIVAKIYSAISEGPAFTKYTNDTIQGWEWEWYWRKNHYGVYEIEGLHPICKSCGTALASKHDYEGSLYCVRCGRTYSGLNLPDESHIKLYIGDTINRDLIPK